MDSKPTVIIHEVAKGVWFGLSFVGGLVIIHTVSGGRRPTPHLAAGILCGMLGGALSGLTLAWRKVRRQENGWDQ